MTDARVLMVDSESTWRGGEAQMELLMRGLLERGVGIGLAAPPGSVIAKKAAALGAEVLSLRIAGGFDLSAVWRLREYVKQGGFDIVHCHSSHAHGIGLMAVVVSGPKRFRRPGLVISRRVDFAVGRTVPSALKYRHGVDVFLAVSGGVRDVLIEGGVSPEKIEIVPDGIDLGKFDRIGDTGYLKTEFGLGDGVRVVGNIAALAPHKSQVDFVRAAKLIRERVPKTKFLIVGEGELRPQLEAAIRELGLERDVFLTGFRHDVLEILSVFDCFVISSYLEGLCSSIMDAHACGIPVVATRTGGIPELVIDGETGLLASPRRPDSIADAVVRMLGDEDLRRRCVDEGRVRTPSYDATHMVDKTLDAYLRVLGSRRKPDQSA